MADNSNDSPAPVTLLGALVALPPELIRIILLEHADLATLSRFAAVNRLARAFVLGLLPRSLELFTSACPPLRRLRPDPFGHVLPRVRRWGHSDAVAALLSENCDACGGATPYVSPLRARRVCRGCQWEWRRSLRETGESGKEVDVVCEVFFALPELGGGKVEEAKGEGASLRLNSDAGVYVLEIQDDDRIADSNT